MTFKHGHEMFDDLVGVIEQVAARSAATGSGAVSEGAGPFSIRRGATSGGSVAGAPLLISEKATLDPYRISRGEGRWSRLASGSSGAGGETRLRESSPVTGAAADTDRAPQAG